MRYALGREWIAFAERGWVDGGRGYVLLSTGDRDLRTHQIVALVGTDGAVVFATRYPLNGDLGDETCSAAVYAIGGGTVAFEVFWGQGPELSPSEDRIYHAPLDTIAEVVEPVQVLTGAAMHVDYLAASARGAAWTEGSGTRAGAIIDGMVFDLGADVLEPELVEHEVVFSRLAGEIGYWSPATGATVLGTLTPRFAYAARTDGIDVAWVELSSGDALGSLMASRYARDAADFAPREIAAEVSAAGMRMSGGYAVVQAIETDPLDPLMADHVGFRVVELATGAVREWREPAGEQADFYPLLVSATELVVTTNSSSGAFLYIVDPASLPAAP